MALPTVKSGIPYFFELKQVEDYLNLLECEYKVKNGELEGNVLA